MNALDPARAGADNGQSEPHDHEQNLGGGIMRLGLALGMAVAAEVVGFVAPETLLWKLTGMALAGVAIWLAGLDVYKKGMAALWRRKLNINALMSVAVTGAFLIGQWPEAAMVMALYAIAELIEARAVDPVRVDLRPDLLDRQAGDRRLFFCRKLLQWVLQ